MTKTRERIVVGGLGLAIGLALGYGTTTVETNGLPSLLPNPPTEQAWRELPGTVDSIHDYVDQIWAECKPITNEPSTFADVRRSDNVEDRRN